MGYRGAALANGGEDEDKVQRRAVGQVELEGTENFALHSEELLLGVGVVHQVAQSRHLAHTNTHTHRERKHLGKKFNVQQLDSTFESARNEKE